MTKNGMFDADDRNEFRGVARRPFDLCYELVIVEVSELEGSAENALVDPPGSTWWIHLVHPDPPSPPSPPSPKSTEFHRVHRAY